MDSEVLYIEDRTDTNFILREFTPAAERRQSSEGDYLGYWIGIYNMSDTSGVATGLAFYSGKHSNCTKIRTFKNPDFQGER